ncbi:MAG: hypothetical protein KDK72_09625, partial [Chlamydiia bacterium]|nr:hypothetical protein [Chlamydiia bacterium]
IGANTALENLDKRIEERTSKAYWLGRVFDGIDSIGNRRGRCNEVAYAIVAVVATIITAALCGASITGVTLICINAVKQMSHGHPPPSDVGHISDWSSQVLVYMVLYFLEMARLARDGDYQRTHRICDETIGEYPDIKLPLIKRKEQFLMRLSHQNVLHKNAFEVLSDCYDVETYRELGNSLANAYSGKNYFRRLWRGVRKIEGCPNHTIALVSGVALPALLGICALLALLGVSLIPYEIAEDINELYLIGHMSEWLVSPVVLTYFAYKLHDWTYLSRGDLDFAKEILHNACNDNPEDARMIKYANMELNVQANRTFFKPAVSSYIIIKKEDASEQV